MMNCSASTTIQNHSILIGSFGASVFITTYIGIYGLGIIIYFACHFVSDSRDIHEHRIPRDFFQKFHHIHERLEIYSELTDENWIRKLYKIYYSDQPNNRNLVEVKTNQCSEKYRLKIQNLTSRETYYVLETLNSPRLTTIS